MGISLFSLCLSTGYWSDICFEFRTSVACVWIAWKSSSNYNIEQTNDENAKPQLFQWIFKVMLTVLTDNFSYNGDILQSILHTCLFFCQSQKLFGKKKIFLYIAIVYEHVLMKKIQYINVYILTELLGY